MRKLKVKDKCSVCKKKKKIITKEINIQTKNSGKDFSSPFLSVISMNPGFTVGTNIIKFIKIDDGFRSEHIYNF